MNKKEKGKILRQMAYLAEAKRILQNMPAEYEESTEVFLEEIQASLRDSWAKVIGTLPRRTSQKNSVLLQGDNGCSYILKRKKCGSLFVQNKQLHVSVTRKGLYPLFGEKAVVTAPFQKEVSLNMDGDIIFSEQYKNHNFFLEEKVFFIVQEGFIPPYGRCVCRLYPYSPNGFVDAQNAFLEKIQKSTNFCTLGVFFLSKKGSYQTQQWYHFSHNNLRIMRFQKTLSWKNDIEIRKTADRIDSDNSLKKPLPYSQISDCIEDEYALQEIFQKHFSKIRDYAKQAETETPLLENAEVLFADSLHLIPLMTNFSTPTFDWGDIVAEEKPAAFCMFDYLQATTEDWHPLMFAF